MSNRINVKGVFTCVFGTWIVLIHAALVEGVGPIQFDQPFSVIGGRTVDVPSEVWAPDNWDRLRGVILALPGGGHDSRIYARYENWRAQAAGHGYAIVGVEYTRTGEFFDVYVGDGPVQVAENMQNLLNRTADELGHPELSNAPLFIFGHSHGSSMASLVAQAVADRTIGFVADKSNELPYLPLPPHFGEAPGVFVLGSDDVYAPPIGVSLGFESWRLRQARVALGVDWGGHDITNSDYVFAFMDETTKVRYPENELPSLTPGNPLQLVNVPQSAGWLGEVNEVREFSSDVTPIEWPEIGSASEFTGDPLARSWLPSEMMAMVYQADNALPVGINKDELRLRAIAPEEGETELHIITGTLTKPYDSIDVYDESGLIAQLGAGSGLQTITYEPTELGNQTFLAVMRYTFGGEPHSTSTYETYSVLEISVVPEPSSALLLVGAIVLLGIVRLSDRASRWG